MGLQESRQSRCEGELQKFGRVEYIIREDKDRNNLMLTRMQYHKDEAEFKRWVDKVKRFKQTEQISKYLMLPVSIDRQNCQMCTAVEKKSTLKICYDKMNYSLLQIIKNRRIVKTFFTEAQVWHLLYFMIKYAAFCEERSQFVGNIHPTNIMVDQKSRLRLFTMLSSPNQQANVMRVKQSRHFDVYIAPQQIKYIHEDNMNGLKDLNLNKIDLFNIGLVLLSTVMLKDCYYIYSRISFNLNQDKLSKLIEEMKKMHENVRYSSMLMAFIQQFLIISPERRKTPTFFYNQLRHYEKQIEQYKPFQFSDFSKQEDSEQVKGWCISMGKMFVNQHNNIEFPQKGDQRVSVESIPKFLTLAKNLKKSTEYSTVERSKLQHKPQMESSEKKLFKQ